MLTIFWIETI